MRRAVLPLLHGLTAMLSAAESDGGFTLLHKGDAAQALAAAEEGMKTDAADANWHRLKIESLLAAGGYDDISFYAMTH